MDTRQQLLSAYITVHFANKAAQQSAYEAKLARNEINKIRKGIKDEVRAAIDSELSRLNKLRDECVIALNALNEEAKTKISEEINNG